MIKENDKKWIFCGGHGKDYFEIEIFAIDRESAIADFETTYIDKKWIMTIKK